MKTTLLLLTIGSLSGQVTNPPAGRIQNMIVDPTMPCNSAMGMRYNATNQKTWACPVGTWVEVGGGGGTTIPAGLITMTTGTCPAGWDEATDLDGVTIVGTIAAHGNAGTTGGSDTITPAGTNTAPVFTGSAGTTSATSAGTPSGTNSIPALTMNAYTPGGSNSIPTFAGSPGTIPAQTFTGQAGTVPAQTISWPLNVPAFTGSSGTVPAQTFTGSSATSSSVSGGTPAGTNTAGVISWPVGVPTIAAGVFTQPTISWPVGVPTFSGTLSTAVVNHVHNLASTQFVEQAQGGTTASTAGTHVMTSVATGGNLRSVESTVAATPATGNPTVGGAASYTPQGSIAWPAGVPTNASGAFAEGAISWPAGVPTVTADTFAGSALSGHTHTLTATGTNGTAAFTPAGTVAWPMNAPTNSIASFTPAGSNSTAPFTPAGTVTAPTFTGTPSTLTGSVTAPAFTGASLDTHTHSLTPAGTNSAPGFTGNAFDNRSAFIRLIFCRKN